PDQIGACALIADFDGLAIDDVQIQTRAQLEALKLYLQVKSPAAVLRAYNLGEELTKRLEVIEAPAELRGDAFMAFAEAHIQHIGRDQGALILLETAYNFILGSDDCAKMRKVCLLMAETLEEMGRVDDAKWYRDEADLHQ
ncbi:MAG: hypothetical protein KDK78_04700, partial [Chlamydiia bacterium]|nr:hypothetical protein [Chlamydiia bacterium]